MAKTKSSFDRIKRHLQTEGCESMVSSDLDNDLETLLRRCDEVRSFGPGFGSVELSPYMVALMRVSTESNREMTVERTQIVASV